MQAQENRKQLLSEIREMYGNPLTRKFEESGFIFPDGTLPRMGTDGIRGEDHAIVMHLYDDISYATSQSPKSDAMCRFLNEGNIRYLLENGHIGNSVNIELGICIEPTSRQYEVLSILLRYAREARIDFTDYEGKCVDSKTYSYINVGKILTDMRIVYRKRLEMSYSRNQIPSEKNLCRSCSDIKCRCGNCSYANEKDFCIRFEKKCKNIPVCDKFNINMGC